MSSSFFRTNFLVYQIMTGERNHFSLIPAKGRFFRSRPEPEKRFASSGGERVWYLIFGDELSRYRRLVTGHVILSRNSGRFSHP